MTWLSRIFFSALLLAAPLVAAAVSGSVELRDSNDPGVRKKKDYSGVVVWLVPVSGSVAVSAEPKHVRMLQKRLLSKVADRDVFTHDHSEFPARVPKSLGIANAFQSFNGKRTTSANTALESLLLSNAVCVPCHSASPAWKHSGRLCQIWNGLSTAKEIERESLAICQPAGFPA